MQHAISAGDSWCSAAGGSASSPAAQVRRLVTVQLPVLPPPSVEEARLVLRLTVEGCGRVTVMAWSGWSGLLQAELAGRELREFRQR